MHLASFGFIFFFVWALALLLAIWAFRVAQMFARRIRRRFGQPIEPVFPTVAVILPIKGVDHDTQANIIALLNQDYPHYRLLFSVESEDDPAIALIERLTAHLPPHKVEIVVAGIATERGQKVHNQLAAVERTDERDEILAFLDADARPKPEWIHALVAPLTFGDHIGATTGYRYYLPATGHPANSVVSVINAGVAALFGPFRRTFAWGGSMALRRKDFFAYGLHSAWQHAVSDDYVLSYIVKRKAGKKIHFVARCMVASHADFNWGTFFEFAIRQYRITRICAPIVWMVAASGAALYLLTLFYTFIFAIRGLVHPEGLPLFEGLRLSLMFLSLYCFSIARGFMLLRAARLLLPEHAAALRRTRFWATLGYPFVVAINLLVLVVALFGRTITWRGVHYTMANRLHTTVRRDITAQEPEMATR